MNFTRASASILLVFSVLVSAGSTSTGCGGEPERPQNLILISVDTLRADHLGAYGSKRNLTPNIDALARESLIFEYAYATAPFTLASLSSLLTGRYPEELGVDWNRSVLTPEVPTLASLLQASDWKTGAVVSNFVLRAHKSGIDAGFDYFDSTFPQLEAVRKFPERSAAATTEAALVTIDKLEGHDEANTQPFFLWVHYQDPHGPYTPDSGTRDRFFDSARANADMPRELEVGESKPEIGVLPAYQFIEDRRDLEFYRAGYEAEIHEADASIGKLLEAMKKEGILERSLVVFVADHGESIGEDDYWFAHGEFLSDALVRVPLFFRVPGRPGGDRTDVASVVDLVPTILSFFAIEGAPETSGRDLFATSPEQPRRPVYFSNLREASRPRAGMIANGYRYLVTPRIPLDRRARGPKREQLWRLGAPDEALEAAQPARAKEMQSAMLAFRQAFSLPEKPTGSQQLTPLEQEQLEALGYVEED